MTDGHPQLECAGVPNGWPCGNPINVHRDYQIDTGKYRCRKCQEKYEAFRNRGKPGPHNKLRDEDRQG